MSDRLTVICDDVMAGLRQVPDESVHMCVTSPPYWALRRYLDDDAPEKQFEIGLEKTPEEYVAKMVEVFREIRRVLRRDGTCWVNFGDSYASGGNSRSGEGETRNLRTEKFHGGTAHLQQRRTVGDCPGLKPKDLCGIPWRVAFALQADGWWLRQDIIWHKPNPMPESVTDRCTKAHEYIFLLTKSARYFFDAEAIKEPSEYGGYKDARAFNGKNGQDVEDPKWDGMGNPTRNKRSVWTVPSFAFPGAHFATYPPDLIKPCILAGTSARGCCPKCGAPWERLLEKSGGTIGHDWNMNKRGKNGDGEDLKKHQKVDPSHTDGSYQVKTTGWRPTCKCEQFEQHLEPCTVLDPFAGSGTTGQVALELGRRAVLIELNPEYVKLIEQRCNVTPGLNIA